RADVAVAEVADQQVTAEIAEPGRSDCHAERRVECGDGSAGGGPRGQAHQEVAAGVELVDETVARAGHVVVLFGILLGQGDEQDAAYVPDAERGKIGRGARVGELTGEERVHGEACVEYVPRAFVKFGGVQVPCPAGA